VAIDRHKIIPVNSSCTGGDRAGRTLRVIVHVSCDTVFRTDLRSDHFQQIELGSDLKHRISVARIAMHFPDVAGNVGDLECPSESVDATLGAVSQFDQSSARPQRALQLREYRDAFHPSTLPMISKMARCRGARVAPDT
jgi:hypothetical protein